MIPNTITLAQAGALASAGEPFAARPLAIVPVVALTKPLDIPAARQPVVGTYFGLFRPCLCGHSSAWHSGAFGDAWRAGEQVSGRCEAVPAETGETGCGCTEFREPDLAS